MKEVILAISLLVDDDVDTENEAELNEALFKAHKNLIETTDWNWISEQYVVVPDDIGIDEYYKLVRTKR